MDGLYSIIQGDMAAGSTFKGIAPTYGDKAARFGISFSDLLEPDVLEKKVKIVLGYHRKLFSAYEENLKAIEESMVKKFGENGKKLFDDGLNTEPNEITKEFHELGLQLKSNIVNLSAILNRAYFVNDESIVFEGAQGFHLDVDRGIYPYGTSSNIFSIESSAGFPLGMIDLNHKHIYGVVKIPMSRVGGGPKPTKIGGTIEDILREKGREYGTTTGRPRDVCWPCEVMVREAIQTCGITDLAIVKTDVLGGIDIPIKVNTHYTHEEMIYKNEMPASMKVFAEMEPNYREEEPWDSRETWEWKDAAKQGIDGLDNTHQIFLANFAKNVNIFNFISNGKVIISVGPSSKAKFSMPFKELVTYATQ
jgi:adenylosuccinate synthase